eukprot:TRINITY_DN50986_c0_g1_i1.p1 TRINITY_DN50986_c0_g1~~TRINITY_DN50986_c0_g1_i1.p1  ORF type:complete len:556 (+),score=222.62 TRINITY_DN50986_c0_g1_i1:53-1720(+)
MHTGRAMVAEHADPAPAPAAAVGGPPWLVHIVRSVRARDEACVAPFTVLLHHLDAAARRENRATEELRVLRSQKRDLVRKVSQADGSGAAGTAALTELEEKCRRYDGEMQRWARDQRIHMDTQAELSELKAAHERLQRKHAEATALLSKYGKDRCLRLEAERDAWRKDCEKATAGEQRVVEELLKSKLEVATHVNEKNDLEAALKNAREQLARLLSCESGSPALSDSLTGSALRETTFGMRLDQRAMLQPPSGVFRRLAGIHTGGEVHCVAATHANQSFATGGDDRVVKLWDIASGEEKTHFRGMMGAVLRVYFSPTGDSLVGTTADGTIHVWHVGGQTRKTHTLTGHTNKVTGACFGDERTLVTCSGDKTLKRWDLSRGGVCTKTTMCWSSCQDICGATGGGSTVATGHFDSGLRFWDTRTVNSIEEIKGAHDAAITSTCFSSCGQKVLSSGREGCLKLWDTRMYKAVVEVPLENFNSLMPSSKACLSPDDAYMCIGCQADGTSTHSVVQVYDMQKKLRASLEQHQGDITQVTWCPDGKYLLSASRDGDVVLWK